MVTGSKKKSMAKKTAEVLNSLEKPEANKAAPGKAEKKSENRIEDYINFLRALASPERLNILEALESQEMCTSDVEHRFFMEQSTASHHLNTLLKANIVRCHKDGRRVFYRVNEDFLYKNYLSFVKTLEHTPKAKEKNNYKTR
jgi:DNA-binding transcriptional ArsR family regulator